MISEKELLAKYNLIPIKVSYKNKTKIIDTEDGKYTIKVKSNNNYTIYQYLDAHNFNNYLPQINHLEEPYEIYPYVKEKEIDKQTKAIDLMYILSLLHNKTTTYQEVNLDKIKEIYEESMNKINYLISYYFDLQDHIENKVYMSPGEYLLIRNMNLIYTSLNNAKYNIDRWYKLKLKQPKERQVLLHNNLSLEHFIEADNNYLINWKKAHQGNVVYDFINFYQNEYQNVEIQTLYEIYQSKYHYTIDEKLLLYALIQIPWKITFKNTNYINTLHVRQLLDYLEKANYLISKEYEKDQKAHQEKLDK